MGLIKNASDLGRTAERAMVIEIIEAGLAAIQPHTVLANNFVRKGQHLQVGTEQIDLSAYERVFVIGFGKGSAGISTVVETTLGESLTAGYVIDTVEHTFNKLQFTLGTHPLPSAQNIEFTKHVLANIHHLTEKDLVLIVVCGGGSALFEAPQHVELETLTRIFDALLKSGATIAEMNVVRKHLSRVKGGGLAKHLYPAKVVSMIFSDVPGNDLSVIASGPTVMDPSTLQDVKKILTKYDILQKVSVKDLYFVETTKEEKYFNKVSNVIMASNKTAIAAMQEKIASYDKKSRLYSDRLQGDAKEIGKHLIENTKPGEILIAGGETTLKVKGKGHGGRNQTVVLASLPFLDDTTIIVSIDTDGFDFHKYAGAIGDHLTVAKAKKKGIAIDEYLKNDDSSTFFDVVGDGILTDRLPSNVADIMMVVKLANSL